MNPAIRGLSRFLERSEIPHVVAPFDESSHWNFESELFPKPILLLTFDQTSPSISAEELVGHLPPGKRPVLVWEDQLKWKSGIIAGRILSHAGKSERIHGRECEVTRIDQSVASGFLDEHHLMSSTKSRHKYGLFHNGELVSVSTFGKLCPVEHSGRNWQSIEMIRFCHKSGVSVTGGLSKLLKAVMEDIKPEDIMTYADRDWGEGESFAKLGFTKSNVLEGRSFAVDLDTMTRRITDSGDNRRNGVVIIKNLGSIKYNLAVK